MYVYRERDRERRAYARRVCISLFILPKSHFLDTQLRALDRTPASSYVLSLDAAEQLPRLLTLASDFLSLSLPSVTLENFLRVWRMHCLAAYRQVLFVRLCFQPRTGWWLGNRIKIYIGQSVGR